MGSNGNKNNATGDSRGTRALIQGIMSVMDSRGGTMSGPGTRTMHHSAAYEDDTSTETSSQGIGRMHSTSTMDSGGRRPPPAGGRTYDPSVAGQSSQWDDDSQYNSSRRSSPGSYTASYTSRPTDATGSEQLQAYPSQTSVGMPNAPSPTPRTLSTNNSAATLQGPIPWVAKEVYASKAQPPSPTSHTMPSSGQPMRFTAKHTSDTAVSPRSRGVSMSMPGTNNAPGGRGPVPRGRQDTDGASVATEALFPQASQGLRPLQVPRTGFNRPGGYTTADDDAAANPFGVNNPPPNFRGGLNSVASHPMLNHEKLRMAADYIPTSSGSPTIKSYQRSEHPMPHMVDRSGNRSTTNDQSRLMRNFEEDLRNKRSHQTDDSQCKFPIIADKDRFTAKTIVSKQYNMVGIVLFLSYMAAAMYYFYVRWTSTLDIGWVWYASIILFVEIFTSTSTIAYSVLLIQYTKNKKTPGLPPRRLGPPPKDRHCYRFDVRVLVPCYKESVEVVENTLRATLNADMPHNSTRTIYVCDDGADPVKEQLAAKLGSDVVYVTGRVREKGEINGKSNNLNNCLHLLYPKGITIPNSEVLVVLDADMVPTQNFFTKILEVMQDDNVALCLTPQGYHNVRPDGDIFNNVNLGFWEYILPGYDAFGYIACTGTNFALRANALAHCGWFPTYTITEDYALGMELKRLGYNAVYLKEYLAYGEAPEDMRNVFRQRSRWCKGQMQVFFSAHCPLFNGGLGFGQRLLYTSACWCYITNLLAVPMAVLVPFIAMVFGVLPFVLNRDFAMAATLYLISVALINLYCKKRWHVKLMWFGTVSCHLLWFTYTKAIFNVLANKLSIKGKTTFKTTKKKGADEKVDDAPGCHAPDLSEMEGTKDFYVLCLSLLLSTTTLAVTVYKLVDQGGKPHLLMVLFWAIYNSIPPFLFIMYSLYNGKGRVYEDLCTYCLFLSYGLSIGGIIAMWLVPPEYDFGQVLSITLLFFDAQKSGIISAEANPVPWRGDSGLNDAIGDYSLVGGWYDGGDNIKNSYTIATTVTFLAWSMIEFAPGYKTSGNLAHALDLIKWGADYLVKCHTEPQQFVAQVGNVTLDHLYWMRPEDMGTMERPAFYVDASMPGTDLLASASAALAASSMAFASQNREYAGALLKESQALYSFASAYLGSYSKWIPTEGQYYSDSYYDDLAWAAAWIYKASGSGQYLKESENWYQMHFKTEEPQAGNMVFDFARSATGVDLLLAQSTNKAVYVDRIEKFLNQWMTGKGVSYTEKGLAMIPPNGTLQYTANAAMLAVLYGKIKTSNSLEYNCWTRKQIAYMLGDTGQSYVVGFGNGSPKKVPHRGSSCPDPGDGVCNWQTGYLNTNINPHILYGALVGGPDKMDNFWDDRSWNSTMNRVSLLNNAGFTAAIAGLKSQGVSEAKCQQGTGLIQEAVKKSQGVRY